jgi:hypothetical protein
LDYVCEYYRCENEGSIDMHDQFVHVRSRGPFPTRSNVHSDDAVLFGHCLERFL